METEAFEKLTLVRKRATSLGLAFVALFIFLSLATFSSSDMPGNHWPPADSLNNVCGRAGATVANWMMMHFGYASYLAALLAIGFAVRVWMKRDTVDAWMGVFGALIMLVSGAAAAQLLGPSTEQMIGSGGIVGIAVSGRFTHYLNTTGAWMATLLLFAFGGLLISADELVMWTVRKLREQAIKGLAAYREKMQARKAARAAARPAPPIKTAAVKTAPPAAPPKPAPAPARAEAKSAAKPEAKPEKEKPERLPPIRSNAPTASTKPIDQIAVVPSQVVGADYELPPLSLLEPPEPVDQRAMEKMIRENSTTLEQTLASFGIGAQVVGIEQGPQVTRYELSLAAGIRVNKVTSLSDDIALAVKAPSVRVVAPIPGRSTVGIEVPNAIKEIVRLIELLTCEEYQKKKDKLILPVLLGKDASGAPIFSDLARMPHLLIAGATGSGKSVCMSSVILTLLMLHRPEDLRFILVDPKMVDLGMFEKIPHLLTPVVTDMKRAPYVLEWATKQMDERYDLLARVGVRHITQYNKLGEEGLRARLGEDFEYEDDAIPTHMPYIVVVVDELADMMMVASKEVEVSITRLAQKSRAVGIHIILATQRPSVDVITGLIKSNLPTRISFQVTSKVDSRTILDRNGAEKLLGSGDHLFVPPGTSELVRVQGTFCSDNEIKAVTDFVKAQGSPAYMMNVQQLGRAEADNEDVPPSPIEDYSPDDLYDDACRIVIESGRGSVSLLQRKLEIGYTRAARLVDMMAAEGIVGNYKGSKAREVVMKLEEWEELRGIPLDQRTSTQSSDEEGYASEAALDAGDDIDEADGRM